MPSIGDDSEAVSLKAMVARLRTSVSSSVLRNPLLPFSLLKLTMREEDPSHRTPLTRSL